MSVLFLGEAIVDLICPERVGSLTEAERFVPHFGGALGNAALACRRAGTSAALAGGVGDDAWGRWLGERLEAEGIDLRWFNRVEGLASPVAFVALDDGGEPMFAIYGDGIEAGLAVLDDVVESAVRSCEALAFGSNSLVGLDERALTRRARAAALEAGRPVCFDPNVRRNRWDRDEQVIELCRELAGEAFCVKANLAEARMLTGRDDPSAAAEGLLELGVTLAVVTLGAQGALVRGATAAEVPGVAVDLVSPLGAGDAFFGTLIAGLASAGWDPVAGGRALEAAVRAGAEACAHLGAQP